MSTSGSRLLPALVASGLLVGVGVAVGLWHSGDSASAHSTATEPMLDLTEDPNALPIPVREETEPYNPLKYLYTTEQMIEVYQTRIKRDPQDHASRATLGTLYLRHAKESGDHASYDRADEMFLASQKLLPSYDAANIGLIAVANARHKFAEAYKLAEALYRANPDGLNATEAQVLQSDAAIELGKYDETEKILKTLIAKAGDPTPAAFLARQSRLVELRGDIPNALLLLTQAMKQDQADGATIISLSWYAARMGEIHLSQGQFAEASKLLESAIADNPVSPDLKIMLAKIRMAEGRAKDAVAIMEEVLKVDQDIDTWLPFGKYLAAVGQTKRAEEQFALAHKKATTEEPTAVRELILHYCDTGKHLPEALALAKRETATRNDVFSCDSLAWAYFKNGKLAEAQKAIDDALRLGTRDAEFHYHAAKIAEALKKPDDAKKHLETANAINPSVARLHQAQ